MLYGPVLEYYFDLPPWLRAGAALLILLASVTLFVLGSGLSIYGFILGILALAGAIPNHKSEWGDW